MVCDDNRFSLGAETLSISLPILQLLSSVSYSCQHTDFFTSLVRFICGYFIIFNAVINGSCFLISLSDSSLLVCRNSCVLYIDFTFSILLTAFS